jgi:hypothetical protein
MSDYTLSARRPSECIFTSSCSGEQTHFPVKTRRATFRSWPTLNANAMQRYNNFPIKRNRLAENRVSLSIFNYHTWIGKSYSYCCIQYHLYPFYTMLIIDYCFGNTNYEVTIGNFRLRKIIFYLKLPYNRKIRCCFLAYLEQKV